MEAAIPMLVGAVSGAEPFLRAAKYGNPINRADPRAVGAGSLLCLRMHQRIAVDEPVVEASLDGECLARSATPRFLP